MPPSFHLSTRLALNFTYSKTATLPLLAKSTVPSLSRIYHQPVILTRRMSTTKGNGDGDQNVDEWKTRVPYRIHEKNEDFKAVYEASCHCGRVQYQLSKDRPLDAKYCHCSTCQRLHGQYALPFSYIRSPPRSPSLAIRNIWSTPFADSSTGAPFQWAAIFHKEDINFTHGHHDLGWYDSAEKTTRHKLPCKVSCAYCRSPIMDEGRNMILLFPTLIKFHGNKENIAKFAPR